MRTKHALKALAALAQESRLAVFKLLVRYGKKGLSAGEIAEKLGIPAATLSFHLSQLSNANMVTSRKEGRTIYYAADFECMQELLTYLLERCSDAASEDNADVQHADSV